MASDKSNTSGRCQWSRNVKVTSKLSSTLFLDNNYITATFWKKNTNIRYTIKIKEKKRGISKS